MDRKMKKGYNIVEVLVILAIISILASVFIGYVQRQVQLERLRSSAYDLKAQLDSLRVKSFSDSQFKWGVVIESGQSSYTIRTRDFSDCSSQGSINRTMSLPSGIRFNRNVTLFFNRMGYPENASCGFGAERIELVDSYGRKSLICIDRFGRITVLHDKNTCPGSS